MRWSAAPGPNPAPAPVLMDLDPRSARLRGLPLALARGLALTVSLGVVGFLATQAGAAGCRASTPDVTPEPSAPGAALPRVITSSPSATVVRAEEGSFLGGSKAPAGGWAFPQPPASAKPAASSGNALSPLAPPGSP